MNVTNVMNEYGSMSIREFRHVPPDEHFCIICSCSVPILTFQESEITGEKETEDADEHSEESLVEKRERIGKLLRATSLQPPEGSGKALHNYREIIRASRNSMPEGPAAAMH